MIGIVFNQQKQPLDFGWESYALRTGLSLFEETYCLGPSVYSILYEHISNNTNTDRKLRVLLQVTKEEAEIKRLQEIATNFKFLRKRKHRQKPEIVFLKKIEKCVNDIYAIYLQEELAILGKYGLPQLAPFYFEEEKKLGLWYIDGAAGEKDKEGRLSRVLTFEVEERDVAEPDVFVFYDRLASEVQKLHAPTLLGTLPNLNMLEVDKLKNVRSYLKPFREELETLISLVEPDEHGTQYFSGIWNTEGVKAFAPRLQAALDAAHELDWANRMHSDFRSELHVGNMNTLELWQLLRDNGFVPDDTWKILEQRRKSGMHCRTTAIMTITSNWSSEALANLSEEETLTHKRKTIDLD